jgi:arylsulfatase A-like enzyme
MSTMPARYLAILLLSILPGLSAPPNIVLIISDDHAWSDYGFMAHPVIRTPNLDKLASQSLAFTRGYVPTSLCRTSLASLMTGLYPHQHRITGNDPPGDPRSAANRARMVAQFHQSKTLTAQLASNGYISHQSGKWWEGECRCCFTECMTHGDPGRGGRHGDEGLKIGRETMQPVFDFIDNARDRPFFLWYAPMMPHTPHNPPERLLSRYRAPARPIALARYYAMIEWFDETVGQLLNHLDRKGLASNTVVLYLADNGWVQLEEQRSLDETRAKMSPYDAGLRTPILLRWPGRIEARRDTTTPVSSIDLAPTILAAAAVSLPRELPGIDLRDKTRLAARNAAYGATFIHTSIDIDKPEANLKYRWIVRDRWKLIEPYRPNLKLVLWDRFPATGWSQQPELFDILADPFEKTNLALSDPSRVTALRRALNGWWRVPE